jgi:ankyrin repeat protein
VATPHTPDETQVTGPSAEQLIVAAASADAAVAGSAYRDLEKLGHCPYIPDSPESPVGLLAAAHGGPDSDVEHVRNAILLLVRQGCDIDQYSAAGLTPLHGSIIGQQPELLRFLLEQGADPGLRVIPIPGNTLGRTIAHLDAYGVALVLRKKYPDDASIREILNRLKPAA